LPRKVRTLSGSVRGNAPRGKPQEQWNRENVQGRDPFIGKGDRWGAAGVKTAKLYARARTNREAL